MKKTLRIGSDIDGVIFNMIPAYLRAIKNLSGLSYIYEDITNYALHKCLNITKNIADKAIGAAQIWGSYPPIKNALFLNIIVRSFGSSPTYFITSRNQDFSIITTTELLKYYYFPFILHHTHRNEKPDLIRELQLDYFIEDCRETALNIVNKTNTKVFLLDAPWNQGALPSGAIRMYDWPQIYKYLRDKNAKT